MNLIRQLGPSSRFVTVGVIDDAEGRVFHAVHCMVYPEAVDKVVVGLGSSGLGASEGPGISLLEPNWGVIREYFESLVPKRRRKRRD